MVETILKNGCEVAPKKKAISPEVFLPVLLLGVVLVAISWLVPLFILGTICNQFGAVLIFVLAFPLLILVGNILVKRNIIQNGYPTWKEFGLVILCATPLLIPGLLYLGLRWLLPAGAKCFFDTIDEVMKD